MIKFINLSLENSFIPNLLRASLIRPIYNSSCKTNYTNYRPITVLSIIDIIIILEKVVTRRLTSFLNKYKIINGNQFGFQKRKIINKLLGNLSNYINSSLSKHWYCLVLFTDFSKAFGTAIVVTDKNVGNAVSVMQYKLNTAAKWCHYNGLINYTLKQK